MILMQLLLMTIILLQAVSQNPDMEELNQDLKNCRLNMPKTFTKIKQKWQHGLFPIAKVTEKETIKKHIPVNVFGKCGSQECLPKGSRECYKMLERDYYFYFSFESVLCKDYVTEKLFYLLEYNVIPIVFGLIHYKEIVPPKSVVDVFDFTSVADLANYLIYLSKNATAYNEYFSWKLDFKTKGRDGMCNLCKKINLEGKTDVEYVNIEEKILSNACIYSSQHNEIKKFINGEKLNKSINALLYSYKKNIE